MEDIDFCVNFVAGNSKQITKNKLGSEGKKSVGALNEFTLGANKLRLH